MCVCVCVLFPILNKGTYGGGSEREKKKTKMAKC